MALSETDCDVLVAGGGLVGLSLALALGDSGLRVTLVDQAAPQPQLREADERHLALNEVSCRILTRLGVLPALGADAAPIRAIHVSSAGEFGTAYWEAAAAGRERFGVVVPAKRLLRQLQQAVVRQTAVQVIAPAAVADVSCALEQIGAAIRMEGLESRPISARVLVIADGAESALRVAAGIEAERHDYQRTAICCALSPERDHDGTAYERFTRTGPVALLPQSQGRCGAIYVVNSADAGRMMSLSDAAYLSELQQAFGYRLGRLRDAGLRVSYPLRRVSAQQLCAPRQVLIGNAAQAVHPVGAQGFNLGLRDAAVLAQALIAAHRGGQDLGDADILESYAESRQSDRAATTGLSHALATATEFRAAPARWLRSLALIAADRIEPFREHLMLGGMGYRGATPELAREFAS